jgi:multidrug resistance efflux pump
LRQNPKAEPKPETKTAPSSSTKKKVLVAGIIILAVLAILAIGFGLGRWWGNSKKEQNRLVLYGNVDLRQVELSFNNSERIAEVLVQEGDKVKRGQIVARLDTGRLKPQTAAAEAEVESQQAMVQKLHHGSRPEEIAQAKANVASAKADQVNAEQQWTRLTALSGLTTGRAISQQDLDSAKAALDSAQAHLVVAKRGLIYPRLDLGRKTSPKGRRNCASIKPNSISSARNWPTLNSFPLAMPWCAPGSWSRAR